MQISPGKNCDEKWNRCPAGAARYDRNMERDLDYGRIPKGGEQAASDADNDSDSSSVDPHEVFESLSHGFSNVDPDTLANLIDAGRIIEALGACVCPLPCGAWLVAACGKVAEAESIQQAIVRLLVAGRSPSCYRPEN
jgi:hypothetical protein